MKKLYVIFVCGILFNSARAQFESINVSIIDNLRTEKLQCIDSTGNIGNYFPLGLDGFSVKIYFAFLDRRGGILRLIGRACLIDSISSPGLSDVEIFTANRSGRILMNKTRINIVTNGGEYISNDGFFDVSLPVKNYTSLYFICTGFFIKEYRIYELFSFPAESSAGDSACKRPEDMVSPVVRRVQKIKE